MPALSPTMQAGNIGAWQKKAGDTLAPGEVLVEIETDKAQMDFEFQEEGVLAKVLKETGEKDVPVGNVSVTSGNFESSSHLSRVRASSVRARVWPTTPSENVSKSSNLSITYQITESEFA